MNSAQIDRPATSTATDLDVIQLLLNGWAILYAPASRTLVMFGKYGNTVGVSMETFVNLRSEGIVSHVNTKLEGHRLLHGRVDFYRLKG